MGDKVFDDIEFAPPSTVKHAARDFAAALAETPQFNTFEHAADRFREDQAAQEAMKAYQQKQIGWRGLLMLDALSAEQKAEFESLRSAFVNQPVAQEYFKAQTEFATLCQELGDTLSDSLGLNYTASCGVSCCG